MAQTSPNAFDVPRAMYGGGFIVTWNFGKTRENANMKPEIERITKSNNNKINFILPQKAINGT